MEKSAKSGVKLFMLVFVFALAILRISVSAEEASVVKTHDAFTLYSDGKLEIRDLEEISSLWYARSSELFTPTRIGNYNFYINPNVSEIILVESCSGFNNGLLEWFPNTKSITVLKPDDDFSLTTEYKNTEDSEGANYSADIEFMMNAWNGQYLNQMTMDCESNNSYMYFVFFSNNLRIISYDIGTIKEEAVNTGCSFQALTCNLDKKLSNIVANDSIIYDGKSHAMEIENEMQIRCQNDHGIESYLGYKELMKGEQYKVSYYNKATGKNGDTTNAGTVQVTVEGINGHTGTLTGYYIIKPQTLNKNNIVLSKTSYTYDGKTKKPKVTVKNIGGKVLKEGTDYTVSYSSNKNAGTAMVTVKGKGNYTGTIKKTFKIAKAKQKISLKVSKKEYKRKALAKKSAKFSIGASAKTKLSYKSSKKKYILVTSKGKVTVKKGTPKGTYKITVTAAAGSNYKAAKKEVKVVVK